MRCRWLSGQVGDPGGDTEHGRGDARGPGRDRGSPTAPEPPALGDDGGNVERLQGVTGKAGITGARPEGPAQGIGVQLRHCRPPPIG